MRGKHRLNIDELEYFVVKVESDIGIRIFPSESGIVSVVLTDADRRHRVFDPVSVAESSSGGVSMMVLPLPRPLKPGMEMVDITFNGQLPFTIVYMVVL